jgi:hypothetical protein
MIQFRTNLVVLERLGSRHYRDARRRLNPTFQHVSTSSLPPKLNKHSSSTPPKSANYGETSFVAPKVTHPIPGGSHPLLVLQPEERKELLVYTRYEFDSHKDETNLDKIRYFISQGRRDFHKFESAIDYAVAEFKAKDEKLRERTVNRVQRPIVKLYRNETIGN